MSNILCHDISPASPAEQEWAGGLMSTTEPWITLGRSREQCLKVLSNPAHTLLLARDAAQRPMGFILLHPEGLAGSPYVRSIAVDNNFRGAGIGTQLLQFAERLLQDKSPHLFLCVSSFNHQARLLYEKLGYEKVGEFKDYVIRGASELLMYKRLRD